MVICQIQIMPNPLFRKFISDNVESAIKSAETASEVRHTGTIGDIREIALKNIFRPILTDMEAIGSGQITDHRGYLSDQTDIIIYSKDINPPLLFDPMKSDKGIYPAETCIYAIEVKSQANASEIRDAIKKAKKIREMKYTPGMHDKFGREINHNINLIVTAFFAFSSDLKEKSEIERYLELDLEGKTTPAINVICIVNKGYWFFNEHDKSWWWWEPTPDHGEVISFLGGIINTIPDAIASRRHPRFGTYLINTNGTKFPFP